MYIFFVIIAVVLADQASKYAIRLFFDEGMGIAIIGDFFSLRYIRNDGAAFSFFEGQQTLLIMVSLVTVVAVSFFLFWGKEDKFIFKLALALIAAGGIGNLIDRIVFGFVTDMISFSIFPPVFNLADIAVVSGCGLLIIYVIFFMEDEANLGKR